MRVIKSWSNLSRMRICNCMECLKSDSIFL